MSFNPLSRLRKGDSKFLEDWEYSFMSNDIDRLFKNIGLQKDKIEIIKKNLELFKKRYSHSLLELIIDEDVFKRETIELLEKEKFSFNENTLQSFLSKTSYGEEYIYNNFKYITPSNREVLYKYVFTYSKNRKKWVGFLAYSNDMETRGSFMLFLFLNYPKLISTIYPNITDFFSDQYGLGNVQQKLTPQKISQSYLCDMILSLLDNNCQFELYNEIMLFLRENYELNDLAERLLYPSETHGNISTYKENKAYEKVLKDNIDWLFLTSRSCKIGIYHKYKDIIDESLKLPFEEYLRTYNNTKELKIITGNLNKIYSHGLGQELEYLTTYYLNLSKDKSIEFIRSGSCSDAYRVGDYVIKISGGKWSYEEIICPNNYLILENLYEHFVRDKNGVVICGIEVERYLKRSAEDIPNELLETFRDALNKEGYIITDSLVNGTMGDNVRLLDSYLDADCDDVESLPDWFKKNPLVLVDRDRIYQKDKPFIKQLRSKSY